jgi:hypothetical protein
MKDPGHLGHVPSIGHRLFCEPRRQDFLEALAEAVQCVWIVQHLVMIPARTSGRQRRFGARPVSPAFPCAQARSAVDQSGGRGLHALAEYRDAGVWRDQYVARDSRAPSRYPCLRSRCSVAVAGANGNPPACRHRPRSISVDLESDPRALSVRLQAHPDHERPEPGVRAQIVESRCDVDDAHGRSSILVAPLQPAHGGIRVAEAGVGQGNVKWG